MGPDEFTAVAEKLWNQVKPLYDALHCYTRVKLTGEVRRRQGEAG